MDIKNNPPRKNNHSKKKETTTDENLEKYDILFKWRGAEYEHYDIQSSTYLISAIILSVIIIYSLVSNNPIVAITFIMIGVAGYLYINKEPRVIDFYITHEGIIAEKELYDFDQIKSFWIFYEPPYSKLLSLRMKNTLLPYIHIPLHDQDPVKIREIILQFVPEIKQKRTLLDALERIIHR